MAFDFEKLEVYKKVKEYNSCMRKEFLVQENIDKISKDQLRRASLSVLLNIAEGTSRFSNASKRSFFVIARGSLFETVALLDYLHQVSYGRKPRLLFPTIKNNRYPFLNITLNGKRKGLSFNKIVDEIFQD